MVEYPYRLITIEKHILPQAKCFIDEVLKQNYNSLNKVQRNDLSLSVICRYDPAIIGVGEHQIVLRAGVHYHNRVPYYMCVKFRNAFCENGDWRSLIKDTWLLGGDVKNKNGGLEFSSDYFLLGSLLGKPEKVAFTLRGIGLYVPFLKQIDVKWGNINFSATLTENLTEGGSYHIYDAVKYIEDTKPSLGRELEDIIKYIQRLLSTRAILFFLLLRNLP